MPEIKKAEVGAEMAAEAVIVVEVAEAVDTKVAEVEAEVVVEVLTEKEIAEAPVVAVAEIEVEEEGEDN